ncbi:hypothetical protein C7441_11611 [Pseudaminobacter salicylatoxidans]|uniref:Uncharacterized protein n=1 Tax=Pseudaminobacter salicylatoxidans TaxID=93369 RepID=A0A316C0A6_PSESE|nr:hypothetical protein [Pseudaminobacter salicylatoxidans]PWJ78346.1 hypothetical protein C7441_11611 [Pseudaminobacter salicylatoxidans]
MTSVPDGIFKPRPTASETKGDMTTRAAREIVERERAVRDAKSERLRLARLAQEQDEVTDHPVDDKG